MSAQSFAVPDSIDAAVALLAAGEYVAERSLATAVFLALRMGRPLFLEGEAGVGKTEVAKVLARTRASTSPQRYTSGTMRAR